MKIILPFVTAIGLLASIACQCPFCHQAEPLYTATPLTATNAFTSGIEGPACDAAGNIFVVNFHKQHTIGRTTPAGVSEVFVTLPGRSIGNGIRFDRTVGEYFDKKRLTFSVASSVSSDG